jgi:hypothetical protein
MLELGSSGSARGVSSNGHPYRDPRASSPIRRVVGHRLQSAESGASSQSAGGSSDRIGSARRPTGDTAEGMTGSS